MAEPLIADGPAAARMDSLLSLLSDAVPGAQSLEHLTRPLLEMLGLVTGLESTYLTTIDLERGVQHVEFARNVSAMEIPEGLDVPWSDTLCKRALDEGRLYTDNVADCWGDSDAARVLGIQTYVSSPVRTQDGRLLGTLCAASPSVQALRPNAEPALKLFSKLIGTFMEREQLVEQLHAANRRLTELAMTDPLTALPNRRAVLAALGRMLAQARRDESRVLVGVVDLDGFKTINDEFGHEAGDQFLRETGRRTAAALRRADVLGRLGGDEFIVLAPITRDASRSSYGGLGLDPAAVLQQRVEAAIEGHYALPGLSLDYGGASVGVIAADPQTLSPEDAIRLADAAMYRVKEQRRARVLIAA